VTWWIVDRADPDAVVIADVLKKKTRQTPQSILVACRRRPREYGDA
jgi:phage-related protein